MNLQEVLKKVPDVIKVQRLRRQRMKPGDGDIIVGFMDSPSENSYHHRSAWDHDPLRARRQKRPQFDEAICHSLRCRVNRNRKEGFLRPGNV